MQLVGRIKENVKRNKILYLQAVMLGLLPLLCCVVHCASQGYTIHDVYLPASEWNAMFTAKLRNWIDAVTKGTPMRADGEEGLMIQKILNGIKDDDETAVFRDFLGFEVQSLNGKAGSLQRAQEASGVLG